MIIMITIIILMIMELSLTFATARICVRSADCVTSAAFKEIDNVGIEIRLPGIQCPASMMSTVCMLRLVNRI